MTMFRSLLLVTLMLAVGSSVLAGPVIQFDHDEFDFGRVAQRATVSDRFIITNTGDQTLEITTVNPGCGCTKAPLADSSLAPGESAVLDLFFSTKSYRGVVSKRPYLETNISEDKVYLKIKAEVFSNPDTLQPLHFSPATLDVSQFRAKPRKKAKFWIHNTSAEAQTIKIVKRPEQVFDVALAEVVPAGDSIRGVITVHDDQLENEFEHSLTIELDDEAGTRYSLPVKRMLRVKKPGG